MSRWRKLKIGLPFALAFCGIYFVLDLVALTFAPAMRAAMGNACEVWHRIVLGVSAGLIGLIRIGRRHPALDRPYRRWLQTTPWTSDMPVPLGAVRLVWSDAALLACGILLAQCTIPGSPFLPLITFGLPYLVVAAYAMHVTRQSHFVLLLFGFGGIIRAWDDTAIVLTTMAAMYGVFWINLRTSLAKCSYVALSGKVKFRRGNLGWPFDALRPQPTDTRTTWPAIFIGAALVGWLAYAIDFQYRQADTFDQLTEDGIVVMAGAFMGLIRAVIYTSRCHSPRPIWARILTGRLIAPGYDYVFLTPIAVGIAVFALIMLAPSPRSAYLPIFLGASLLSLILIAFGG
jgi:hypothetical protein